MLDSAKDVLRKYVSDMGAVTRHVQSAVERQVDSDDFKQFPEAKSLLTEIKVLLENQRTQLDSLAAEIGAEQFSSAKEAVTTATGFITGLYDHLRSHPVSKDLRDDYVALTLCCVAYEMLHTTGLAVQHPATADLALRALKQLTPYVSKLGQTIPQVVVREVGNRGVDVDPTAAKTAADNNRAAWSHQAGSGV